jgi:hypothetical protein
MSNRGTDCVAILIAEISNKGGNVDVQRIEALEVENFELRNEVTRLTVHNATLRRMLTNRSAKHQ